MKSQAKPITFKYLLVGDSGVGKTSLLKRFTEGTYDGESLSTIGIDFKSKIVPIPSELTSSQQLSISRSTPKNYVTLNIWDTAGQERFQTITKSFYRGTQGIILLFSVLDKQSFINVSRWIDNIREEVSMDSDRVLFLVGSKADSTVRNSLGVKNENIEEKKEKLERNMREVSTEEGRQLAQKYEIEYIEVSSKQNRNVQQLFSKLTYKICQAKLAKSTFKCVQSLEAPQRLVKKNKRKQCC